MIRVASTEQELLQTLDREYSGWSKWGDIKPLFLDLQYHKCGFCESEIGGRPEADGRRELHGQDVEHYRPKGRVVPWEPPGWPGVPEMKHGPHDGYPWLALNPLNYMASCKACNSGRKKNFFPVADNGQPYEEQPSPADLAAEQPYLLFPFGDLDPDEPESHITFFGYQAIAHPNLPEGSHAYWRAKVTIALLGLNRADVAEPRKSLVVRLAQSWCTVRLASPQGWSEVLRDEGLPQKPFSSCAKSYLKLCEELPKVAQQVAVDLAEELESGSAQIEILRNRWPGVNS